LKREYIENGILDESFAKKMFSQKLRVREKCICKLKRKPVLPWCYNLIIWLKKTDNSWREIALSWTGVANIAK